MSDISTEMRDCLPSAIITPCSDHFLPVYTLYGVRLGFRTFMLDDRFRRENMSRVPIRLDQSQTSNMGVKAYKAPAHLRQSVQSTSSAYPPMSKA
jgi:hypothetical protein